MSTRSRPMSRLCRLVLAAGALLAPAAFAQEGRPYTFYWSVNTNEYEMALRSKTDWAAKVEFDDAPINRNIYIFYGQYLGNYPRFGIHQAYVHPGWLEEHFRKVRVDVEQRLPPDYDGMVCIDYENWNILWERLVNRPTTDPSPDAQDEDFKDDWKDYLKTVHPEWPTLTPQQQEELARSSYNAACKDFFLRTIQLCKELRPRAKWGVFDFPNTLYGSSPEQQPGTIGYPADGKGLACERNDELLGWLWEISDVLFPAPYNVAMTVPDGQPTDWNRGTNTVTNNRQYQLSNVREAVRLAKGKPVIMYMWWKYMVPRVPSINHQFLNDINLQQCLELPYQAGADGVAFWDCIHTPEDFPPVQEIVRNRIKPMIHHMISAYGIPQDTASSGGGGAGGGGSGGGTAPGGGPSAGAGSGSAGGMLPEPPKVGGGVVSNNAFIPNKGGGGATGGWVPPKPSGQNNNNNTVGQKPPISSPVMSRPSPFKVVTSGVSVSAMPQATTAGKAAASSNNAKVLSRAERLAAIQAIRRVQNSKPVRQQGLASAPDRD